MKHYYFEQKLKNNFEVYLIKFYLNLIEWPRQVIWIWKVQLLIRFENKYNSEHVLIDRSPGKPLSLTPGLISMSNTIV